MVEVDPETCPPGNPNPQTLFSQAIALVIAELDSFPNQKQSIRGIARKYQIKLRRLYDAINIFAVIGCITKTGIDQISWNGRNAAIPKIREEMTKCDVDNPEKTLADLFPLAKSIGLPQLCISLIMLFRVLHTEIIDLREASCFLSRNTAKYKPILSKLYQITMILGLLDFLQRTSNVCEVRLGPALVDRINDKDGKSPLAIEVLLNRSTIVEAANRRNHEYRTYWENRFRR
jgi:hypothetical protein